MWRGKASSASWRCLAKFIRAEALVNHFVTAAGVLILWCRTNVPHRAAKFVSRREQLIEKMRRTPGASDLPLESLQKRGQPLPQPRHRVLVEAV